MSTVEKLCAYCRQPLRLKWKNGLIPLEGVYLVADQVFHDKCWDKYLAIGTYQEDQTGRSGRSALSGAKR